MEGHAFFIITTYPIASMYRRAGDVSDKALTWNEKTQWVKPWKSVLKVNDDIIISWIGFVLQRQISAGEMIIPASLLSIFRKHAGWLVSVNHLRDDVEDCHWLVY